MDKKQSPTGRIIEPATEMLRRAIRESHFASFADRVSNAARMARAEPDTPTAALDSTTSIARALRAANARATADGKTFRVAVTRTKAGMRFSAVPTDEIKRLMDDAANGPTKAGRQTARRQLIQALTRGDAHPPSTARKISDNLISEARRFGKQ